MQWSNSNETQLSDEDVTVLNLRHATFANSRQTAEKARYPPPLLIGRISELATKSAQGFINKRVIGKVAQTNNLAAAADSTTY